jgi:hypothetical protein
VILLQSRYIGLIPAAALAASAVLAVMFVVVPSVLGTDSEYAWEKWRLPWRAEAEYIIGGCGYDDPACTTHQGDLSRYSLDFALHRGNPGDPNNGVPVHSLGEGVVVTSDYDDASGAGWYVSIKTYDPDRNPPWVYAFYCHLRDSGPEEGTHVEQRQIIAVSGKTGAKGVHLHLRLSTQNFAGDGVKPEPMSGYEDFKFWDEENQQYGGNTGPFESNNVAPGDTLYNPWEEWDGISWPDTYDEIREAFNRNGVEVDGEQMGWPMVGSTYDWWTTHEGGGRSQEVHPWGNGWVQDFIGPDHGHGNPWGVITLKNGATDAYWVHGDIWDKYREEGGATGWLGYPVNDEEEPCPGSLQPPDCARIQYFENGCIWVKHSGGVFVGPDHDLAVKQLMVFGPAPINLSDTTGRYMWTIAEIGNLRDHVESAELSLDIDGNPGCIEDSQQILPGPSPFTLTDLEQRWVLFRTRFECHAPVDPVIHALDIELCIDHIAHPGGGDDTNTANDCQARTKSLLLE